MKTSLRSSLMTGAAVAVLSSGIALAPSALAATAPKAGSTCTNSGQTMITGGNAYVCTSKTTGAKPTWDAGKAVSKSPLTLANGWAKAADSGMSAAFGMLKNPTGKEIRVIGVSSPYSTFMQLHEMVMKDGSMVMQQKEGGLVIPADGMVELKPGGNHLMFMNLTKPITAGTMIPVKLITADGGVLRTQVMAKVFAGANEEYDPSMGSMDQSQHGM